MLRRPTSSVDSTNTARTKRTSAPKKKETPREGKHSAKLAPLMVTLPKDQRALGLVIASEHADTRDNIAAEVAEQLAPTKQDYGTPPAMLLATLAACC